MKLSSPKLKKLLYFFPKIFSYKYIMRKLEKPKKQKNLL